MQVLEDSPYKERLGTRTLQRRTRIPKRVDVDGHDVVAGRHVGAGPSLHAVHHKHGPKPPPDGGNHAVEAAIEGVGSQLNPLQSSRQRKRDHQVDKEEEQRRHVTPQKGPRLPGEEESGERVHSHRCIDYPNRLTPHTTRHPHHPSCTLARALTEMLSATSEAIFSRLGRAAAAAYFGCARTRAGSEAL